MIQLGWCGVDRFLLFHSRSASFREGQQTYVCTREEQQQQKRLTQTNCWYFPSHFPICFGRSVLIGCHPYRTAIHLFTWRYCECLCMCVDSAFQQQNQQLYPVYFFVAFFLSLIKIAESSILCTQFSIFVDFECVIIDSIRMGGYELYHNADNQQISECRE